MQAVVKKWGNSYAIRLTKRDLAALHVREGQRVDVQISSSSTWGKVDLGNLPTFHGGGKPFKEIRDEYYDSMPERWQR